MVVNNNMGDYRGIETGFSYNGVHSRTYHVEYIPDASSRWFAGPEWEVYDSEVAWHPGGYYYGNAVKTKVFTLSCYFEEITVKQREDIRKWLHRDTSGSLVLDNMPFVYWNVRPTKIVTGKIYNDGGLYSGVFDVTFSAYNPFGYLTRKYNGATDNDNAGDYCDLIAQADMPTAPTTSDTQFDVYNPGRETCGLILKISGSTDNPIEFLNTTNKTRCIISELPANGLVLDINGDTGVIKTYASAQPSNYEFGYSYHDRGFIRLENGLNAISIMEQNENGNWTTPSTLSLSSIEIDYAPRIL